MNRIRTHVEPLLRVPILLMLFVAAGIGSAIGRSGTQSGSRMTIQGKVVDDEKEPMAGVTIMIPGTTQGTVTGVGGTYTLDVPRASKELEFSFIGMRNLRVAINNRTRIDVEMQPDLSEIETVIVTGYGNIAKEAYTGSASVLGASRIGDRAISSIENAIRGNVTGAIVTSTGQPGESSDIRLRGIGSMNASNQPLYVVDGVIWDTDNMSGTDMSANNPLNSLNPSDIESTTILRDAASASLYGSRGANGVIVITTKQGKLDSRTLVSVNMQSGVSMLARYPDFVNGREFADLWVEGKMHANLKAQMIEASGGSSIDHKLLVDELTKLYLNKDKYLYKGKNFYEYEKVAKKQFNELFRLPTGDGGYRNYDYFGADYDKLPDTDWYKEISRVAPFVKLNVSLSGGTSAIKYYASLEHMDQQGIIINSQLKRQSLRVKLSSDDRKRFLNWGVNTSVSNAVQSGPLAGGSTYGTPMYAAMRLPSVVPAFLEDGSYNFYFPSNLLNSNHNPVASARENKNSKPQLSLTSSANIRLNFTPWLNMTSNLSVYYLGLQRRMYNNKEFGDGIQYDGRLTERDAHRTKIANTTMLFFDRTIKKDHKINVAVGLEIEDMNYKFRELTVARFLDNNNTDLSNGSVVNSWYGGGYGYAQVSYISKADYSYRSRYYLSGSFRQDHSSRFLPENRKGNFWSVSGAWRVSSEPFWKPISNVVNSFRVKSSYGINGNLPSQYYPMTTYSPSNNMNNPSAIISSLSYSDLSWEKNAIWNIGVDMGLLKSRIRASVEYYRRKSNDLLLDLPISSTSGFATKLQNSPTAGIRNQGVEIEINATPIASKNWTWTVSANIATLDAEYYGLESRFPDSKSRQITQNGYSPNTWWLRPYGGISQETGQQLYVIYKDGERILTPSSTGVEYETLNQQGIPKYTGGFSTSISYKNLQLSALFSFAGGHYIYDRQGASYTENDGNELGAVSVNQLDRWTPLTPNASAPIRIVGFSTSARTTRFLVKGDYLKLRHLSLSYSLPEQWTRPMSLRSLRLFAQAENLWVLTKMKDYDPELSIDGYRNYDSYPFAVTITGGISFNF